MILRKDVKRLVGEPDFSRGEVYFRQGRVRSMSVYPLRDRLSGSVSGSRGKVYSQDVKIAFDSEGLLVSVEGICSCPAGYNCEHVAALLLRARLSHDLTDGNLPAAPASGNVLPEDGGAFSRESKLWLDAVSRTLEDEPLLPPADSLRWNRILYVFRRNGSGRPEIAPRKARFGKDGAVEHSGRYANVTPIVRRDYLELEDVSIIPKIFYFGKPAYGRSDWWPEGEELLDFLKDVVETGRARAGDVNGPRMTWGPPRALRFEWETDGRGEQSLKVFPDGVKEAELFAFPELMYLDFSSGLFGRAETEVPPALAVSLTDAPGVPPAQSAAFARQLEKTFGAAVPKPREMEVSRRRGAAPRPVLTLSGVSLEVPHSRYGYVLRRSTKTFACARVDMEYKGVEETAKPGRRKDLTVATENGVDLIVRSYSREREFAQDFKTVMEDFGALPPGSWDFGTRKVPDEIRRAADRVFPPVPENQESSWPSLPSGFTTQVVPRLRAQGWRVQIEESWPCRLRAGPVVLSAAAEQRDEGRVSLSFRLGSGEDEIDMVPLVLSAIRMLPERKTAEGGDDFNLERFFRGLRFFPEFEDGTRALVEAEELLPFIRICLETGAAAEFHRAEAGLLSRFAEELEESGGSWRGGKEILELGKRLRALSPAPGAEAPSAMESALRPYQKTGCGWLLALSESGFGGILADDMGLGKTVQALALLARRHLEAGSDRPSLVVVPASLVGHWVREAARFVPGLRMLPLQGPDRKERFCEIPDHHVVVTTYPLLARDHKELFSHEYDTAVLDEAQAVKNTATAAAKRIRGISARHRVALAGTPMENNLGEIWSLFDWLIPGFLGDRRSFGKNYRTPIEKRGDKRVQAQLSKLLKPFILRRAREEVEQDLPPKTEMDEIIPLAAGQRTLYETVRAPMDKRVRREVRKKGVARSGEIILDSLLKLRQVCCDPALVKLRAARKFTESAKRDRLLGLLEELAAAGRRVLVFSHFVEMLRLIEWDVADRGWSCAALHGRTKDRGREVEKFRNGETDLFLISLGAGGTGLNLAAADTVILYDPWWNLADERQAVDCARGTGEGKPVFVYRLIAEGSLEATMAEMRKRNQEPADVLPFTQGDIETLMMPIGGAGNMPAAQTVPGGRKRSRAS